MAVLKSNLCPTCGGLLDIDLDKQMYICTFCGVSFDYEYFREDNVKEVASKALIRNEYGSAKDAYDFMLTKDPHDFEALRGLFLCKNKWTDMKQMYNESEVHVSSNEPTLLNAIDKCRPEHKPYFEKVREALNELHHYRDLKAEEKSINDKKKLSSKKIHEIQEEIYNTTHLFTEIWNGIVELGPKAVVSAISLAVLLPLYLIISTIHDESWSRLIAYAVIAAVVIGGYHLIKFIVAKILTASMAPHKKELAELTEQHDNKKAEAEQSFLRYKALIKEFTDMDPTSPKVPSPDTQE